MPIIRSSRLYLCYCRIWCVMPWLLVARPGWGKLCDWPGQSHNLCHSGPIACWSAPNSRPATNALHTICGNNTSIVASSWWWAYKCPKHVEQIISAIKHSVASSWFSSLHLYNDARTNIHQLQNYIDVSDKSIGVTSPYVTVVERKGLYRFSWLSFSRTAFYKMAITTLVRFCDLLQLKR